MQLKTQYLLKQVNEQFYQKNADTFDQSRQHPWTGWNRILPSLKDLPQPFKVLDLGCGNGRFATFLSDNQLAPKLYEGIDNNARLIQVAKNKVNLKNAHFQLQDIDDSWNLETRTYDLVVIFGVLHHIPGFNHRLKLIQKAFELTRPEGLLVVSFWQFFLEPKYKLKLLDFSRIGLTENEIESGDFLLDWQKTGVPRYCHHSNDQEINRIICKTQVGVFQDYKADGNRYIVWKR